MKNKFRCEVCSVRIEDWVAIDMNPDDVQEIELQFSYCPNCGTPYGMKKYAEKREQVIGRVQAVCGVKLSTAIRVITTNNIALVQLSEPFCYQGNHYMIVSDGKNGAYSLNVCKGGEWKSTGIAKTSMEECVLTLVRE